MNMDSKLSSKKIKIIHVEHCSHSYFLKDEFGNPDEIVKGSWATQVAVETKKLYPDLEVECWFPEKLEREVREIWEGEVRLRIFPTTFSPRYALDFSLPMIVNLKKEVETCEREGKKVIIHIHEYHNLHGLVLAKLFNGKIMIAQHHGGSWPLKHLRQTRKYKFFFPFFLFGQFLEKKILKNIGVFYALSKEEIDYLYKMAPKSKIKFQPMGILKDYFIEVNRDYARKKLKIKKDKKIIIFIGRISEEKGIKYLLDSMKKLGDVDLKIIGNLQKVNYFKSYAKNKRLKNVEFLGGVFGEKKLLYLSAADALVLPSLKEGAPVVIMEAVARNLPVVATDVGGVPLMIKNNREGIIIKQKNSESIANAVEEILQWKGKNIKKYANKYKWKKIIDRTVEDYRNIGDVF